MKKILSLLAALSLVSVSFAASPKAKAESPQAAKVADAKQAANDAQTALLRAAELAQNIPANATASDKAYIQKLIAAEYADAARYAAQAENDISQPGVADGDPAAALAVSQIVAQVYSNNEVIAANPDKAAATAVQLAYIGSLTSVQNAASAQGSDTKGITQTANAIANSPALNDSQKAQLLNDITTATNIAVANQGIDVTASTAQTSVNPTVVSVSQ
jgi:hypothetical protein